jgi:ferrous iron transport protein B
MKSVLLGPPNSGKTTVYNWLTGHQAKVVNYPGSTVDYASGRVAKHWTDLEIEVIDSPGTYSLLPKSEDEEVTYQLLRRLVESKELRNVVLVIDPTQLQRHLHLALQVKSLGLPMILVLTMKDLLAREKISLEVELLKNYFQCPVIQIDGRFGGGIDLLVSHMHKPSKDLPKVWGQVTAPNSQEIKKLAAQFIPQLSKTTLLWSNTLKFDNWLLHPIIGFFAFFGIMTLLFTSVYSLAAPLMDLSESLLTDLGAWVLTLGEDNLFIRFLSEGLISSFAAVVVFLPQIFILFFMLSLLEGSGYLARAATIIDKPFSKIGLSGRSFVPFLSGYACAVPALMATRNIHSKNEKWVARMIIPLLSCSARLPVYGLLLGFLFWNEPAWKPGLSLALLYIMSMFVATLAAGFLSRLIKKGQSSLFVMELPLYRMPMMKSVFIQAFQKSKSFLLRAGPVIFVLSVALWFGMNFPRVDVLNKGTTQLEESYLGKAGRWIEPVFEPMGLDWRGGVGLMAAFAAREVFVSTLAVLYHSDEALSDEGLISQLKKAQNSEGHFIYTPSVIVGLIAFFMIALQCLSTVGVMIRESQSWRLGFIQLVAYNIVAYVVAVILVQGLRLWGVA